MVIAQSFSHSWEQAIDVLRADPLHQSLIYDAYLTADLHDNAVRFAASTEFAEVLALVSKYQPNARDILDIPGGNGIATYAFARAGFNITSVEPDPSSSVGRGAIAAVLNAGGLQARIVEAFGEQLPFESASFDIVYVRQGLHHANDLKAMLLEYARVLRPNGILLACREHVVDDYGRSLDRFLSAQVDHQLYGGEHAFTLSDYRAEIDAAGLIMRDELLPYDSPINLHPNTAETLHAKILGSRPGRVLNSILPARLVCQLGMWRLRRAQLPGRLYSFIAESA